MNNVEKIHQQVVLGKKFEIYGTNEDPLFLARDVASWIEHSNITHLVNMVDEDEKLTYTILNSGQNRQMWFLTEDGLYEVLMQSRKPIAKEFKKQVKSILKEIRKQGAYVHVNETDDDSIIMAKAIFAAQRVMERKDKEIETLQETIKVDAPYTNFGKIVSLSDGSVNVGVFAKMVYEQHGIKIGRNNLLTWLRERGFLIKQKGREYNLPKQKYIEQGLFEVRTAVISRTSGDIQTGTTLITGKGQIYLTEKLQQYFKSEVSVND